MAYGPRHGGRGVLQTPVLPRGPSGGLKESHQGVEFRSELEMRLEESAQQVLECLLKQQIEVLTR